mmetsp:Transcript_25789/g.24635  ORF Transcript_25789/g.24635 Transcript_25789/m.24635 type:complete len:361 (+) Transcript_25789:57-1139(+)
MEVLEPIADNSRELLTELTVEYEALKDDYTLQGARKQMLDNLITDKFDVLDNIEVVDTAIKQDLFLSKAKELSNTIDSFNAADTMTEDNDSQLDDNLQIELNRGQELLRKILDEQVAVNASIIASRKQIHELNNDVLSFKENEKKTNVINSVELIENDAQISKIHKSHQKSEDLYSGLRYLTGVESLEVTESEDKEGVKLLITVGECSVFLTLDAEKRLSDIKVINGKSIIDVKKLLQDSRVLPCPQDLRYAVFALGASQNAVECVRKDLQELRKTCLVKALSPLRFELELPNSLSAIVSIHECYPEVPGGVYIESLLGIDKSPSETDLINSAKASTNSCCFRTIPDAFQFLLGSKNLGF